jgi:hypothetical protein
MGVVNPRLIAVLLLVVLGAAAAPASVLVTENFDTNTDLADSGWEFLNNRTSPENYGWSNTNNTGSTVVPPVSGAATGAGELGGTITRAAAPATFYGVNVGSIDPGEDFEARGVIRYSSGSGGFNLGFFRGASSYGSGGDAVNFAGFFFDDAHDAYATVFDAGGSRYRSDSPYDLVAGRTHAFRMQYKTNGFNPDTLVVTLDGNAFTHPVGMLAPPPLLPFTHFGILPTSAAGNSAQVWLDDLTFSSNRTVPEPGGLALLASCGVLALRRARVAGP